MNKLVINDYLSSLQQQIAVSVDRLKYKTAAAAESETAAPAEERSYGRSGRLSEKAYSLLKSEVSYQMLSYAGQPADAAYAARSYDAAAGVDKPSTVLINFMFAGNREFDFKV